MRKQAGPNHKQNCYRPVEPIDMQRHKGYHQPSEDETREYRQNLNAYLFEYTQKQRCFKSDSSYPNDHNPVDPFLSLLSCEAVIETSCQNHEDDWKRAQEIVPRGVGMAEDEEIEADDDEAETHEELKWFEHQCQVAHFVEWTCFWGIVDYLWMTLILQILSWCLFWSVIKMLRRISITVGCDRHSPGLLCLWTNHSRREIQLKAQNMVVPISARNIAHFILCKIHASRASIKWILCL